MTTLVITVLGEPMSKGSKVAETLMRGGEVVFKHGRPVTFVRENNQSVKERDARGIAAAALAARTEAGLDMLVGVALHATLRYYLPSPQGRYGSGRNAGLLKDNAPARPAKKPDVDKLSRHTLDALTGVVYRDDGQVVSLRAEKHFAEGQQPPRTEIEISVLPQQTVGMQVADEQLALAA